MESGKHNRKKFNYTIMIVSDSPDGKIKPLCLGPTFIKIFSAVIGMILLISVCAAAYHSSARNKAQESEQSLQKKVQQLTDENKELTAENTELNEKIALLSDTVNQKMANEEALAAKEEEKKTPSGFPLAGTGVIVESSETQKVQSENEEEADAEADAEEQDGEDAEVEEIKGTNPIVVLSAAPGTQVIATADGEATPVDADPLFGYRIEITHESGYISISRTLSNPEVVLGDKIEKGHILFRFQTADQLLGYQIMKENAYIDPLEMMEMYG